MNKPSKLADKITRDYRRGFEDGKRVKAREIRLLTQQLEELRDKENGASNPG